MFMDTAGIMESDQAYQQWTGESSFNPSFTEETRTSSESGKRTNDPFLLSTIDQDILCPVVHRPAAAQRPAPADDPSRRPTKRLKLPQDHDTTKTSPARAVKKNENSTKHSPPVVEQPPAIKEKQIMSSHDWSTNNLQDFLGTLDWKRVYRADTTSETHGAELSTPGPRGPSVVHKPPEVVEQYPVVVEKPDVSEWKTDNLQDFLSTLDWQSVYHGGKAPPPTKPEHD